MKTPAKIIAFCNKPRTAQEISDHCNMQRSGIYSALGRLQLHGFIKRVGSDPASYIASTPTVVEPYENLVIKHAHNPFGLRA